MRFSPGCQCCAGDQVPNCCGCDLSPFEWTFSLSGIGGTHLCGFDFVSCTNVDGDYTLTYIGGASCQWTATGGTSSCGQVTADLVCDATYWYVEFQLGAVVVATYRLLRSSWNCLAANTLDLMAGSSCTGWPSTLTITPA